MEPTITTKICTLVALKDLHADPNKTRGICSEFNAYELGSVCYLYMRRVMLSWPKRSHDVAYPIPSSIVSPSMAYVSFNRWSRRSKYGKARWELLEYMIATIEEDIRSNSTK